MNPRRENNGGVVLKCEICLEYRSDAPRDRFVNTPCGHVFHETHIRRWVNENVGSRCPVCKSIVSLQKLIPLFGYDPSNRKLKVKLALLGDSSVGKTCLVKRFSSGQRRLDNLPTTGIDIQMRDIEVDFENVRVNVWDPSGQDRFRDVIPQCLREVHGVLFCYDPMHFKSLVNVYQVWKEIATKNIKNESYVSILVECKNDLSTCKCEVKSRLCRPVTASEKQLVLQLFGNEIFSTSTLASSDENLEAPFKYIVRQILRSELLMEDILNKSTTDATIKLKDDTQNGKICCC